MLLNGCEEQKFCHVFCFLGALKWLTSLLFFLYKYAIYKYAELKLYLRVMWFKVQLRNF